MEKYFYLPKQTCFFRNVFFSGNQQQSNARAGQKKSFLFSNAQHKSNACANLKERKNIVALYSYRPLCFFSSLSDEKKKQL